MNDSEASNHGLDQNLEEVRDLKIAALGLLLGSPTISREVQMQIKDIFDKAHIEKTYLVRQLADFLSKKNPKIFEVDGLTKQGHELGKSATIAALNLSDEDATLLEWFQQVRA